MRPVCCLVPLHVLVCLTPSHAPRAVWRAVPVITATTTMELAACPWTSAAVITTAKRTRWENISIKGRSDQFGWVRVLRVLWKMFKTLFSLLIQHLFTIRNCTMITFIDAFVITFEHFFRWLPLCTSSQSFYHSWGLIQKVLLGYFFIASLSQGLKL